MFNEDLKKVYENFAKYRRETKLSKTPESKNITISDWNTLVAFVEALLYNMEDIYKVLPVIDENLISDGTVFPKVYDYVKNYLSNFLGFDSETGDFKSKLLIDDETLSESTVSTGLHETFKEATLNEAGTKLTLTRVSGGSVEIPIFSGIVSVDERKDGDGVVKLFIKLKDGAEFAVPLDDVVKGFATTKYVNDGFVSKSTAANTVYGVNSEGQQTQLSIERGDDTSSDWNEKVVSKQYAWLRNSSRSDQVKPTGSQIESGTAVGWYRIAERSDTSDGTGGCTSIFKLHCYGTSKGESTLIFSVSMAEHSVTPAICILSNSYRLGTGLKTPPITKVRVNRDTAKYGKAYVEVYLNVSPTLSAGKTCVRFKTETLLYDSHRRWGLVPPTFTNVSFNVTEKSAVDYSWSDVNVSTSYLNALPTKFDELEDKIANSSSSSSEWDYILDVYSLGDFRENKTLIVDINAYGVYCNVVEFLIHTDYDGYHDVELVTARFSQREPGNLLPSIISDTSGGAVFEQDSEFNLRLQVPLTAGYADGPHGTQVYIKEKLYKYPGIYSAYYGS